MGIWMTLAEKVQMWIHKRWKQVWRSTKTDKWVNTCMIPAREVKIWIYEWWKYGQRSEEMNKWIDIWIAPVGKCIKMGM